MITLLIVLFIIGYISITLEHSIHLDKAVPALLMATLMWAVLAFGFNQGWLSVINHHGDVFNVLKSTSEISREQEGFKNILIHHFSNTGEILFFLIGAMTIVEIIDLHRGFGIIKKFIKAKNKKHLLWTLGSLAFILSVVIDNLTTIIILIALLRKILVRRKYRIWYASMMVIAANAGGAWSPIGDVTTTMLWIGDKVTSLGLTEYVVIPSIVCFVVPFFIATKLKPFRGYAMRKEMIIDKDAERLLSSKTMLIVGLSSIAFVPIFKAITGLPPYLGMMFSLAIVWLVSEYVKPEKNISQKDKFRYSTHKALSKIEFSSILFFLGILLAVGALETVVFGEIDGNLVGTLRYAAESLSNAIPSMNIVIILLGLMSSIIDNVPLVAASMGMYNFPIDNPIWHFIAYSAGNGGSILIIGSAAGVAAMGMEKIDFIWYFKKVSWLAFLGFIAGCGVFIFIETFFYS
ncbi:sodium:proton antiporter NhaD [Psychroflexus sp. MBR-150]|jgi:Na+/H+ antiporter NhaD/arsenite permease-like protein